MARTVFSRNDLNSLRSKTDHVSEAYSENIKTYADIKSKALLDSLRAILKDVRGVSLRAKHPSIRLEILYAFLPDFKDFLNASTDPTAFSTTHLAQLVSFLEDWFASATEEVSQLLKHGEITYDTLWALFKPNGPVYTNDTESEQPKCLLFDFGEFQDLKGSKYYEMVCRSLYYDGKFFGEVQSFLQIPEFRGARDIGSLEGKSTPRAMIPSYLIDAL